MPVFSFIDNERHVTDYVAFVGLTPRNSETNL